MPPEGYSVSLSGTACVRNYQGEGSENSADESGTLTTVIFHVEDGRSGFYRAIHLVRGSRQAGVSTDDVPWLPVLAVWDSGERIGGTLSASASTELTRANKAPLVREPKAMVTKDSDRVRKSGYNRGTGSELRPAQQSLPSRPVAPRSECEPVDED